MPSAFDQDLAAAGLPMLMDQLGEPVTYFPAGGASRSITAIVRERGSKIEQAAHHDFDQLQATLLVYRDDSTGMTAPGRADAIRLEGEAADVKWDFEAITEETQTTLVVKFGRKVPKRGGYLRPPQL